MVKKQNRKTSISFSASISESSSDKNLPFALSFRFSLKCNSENNILIKKQLSSQKIIDQNCQSNQEIFFEQKVRSLNQLEQSNILHIKSEFCINSKDDIRFDSEIEEKFFTFEKKDQLISKMQGFYLSQDSEVYLQDSFEQESDSQQYFNTNYSPETSIQKHIHFGQGIEVNSKKNLLIKKASEMKSFQEKEEKEEQEEEETKQNLNQPYRQIQHNNPFLYSESKLQMYDNDEESDGASSNQSYYSFNSKITKWKEENWKKDSKFDKLNLKQVDVSSEQQNKNQKTTLLKLFSFLNLSSKPSSERLINTQTSSDDSFYSFTNQKKGAFIKKNKNNQIENEETQTLQFKEDLDWLDYQLEIMRGPNEKNQKEVFEPEQILESNQEPSSVNSSEYSNMILKNQQEQDISMENIKSASSPIKNSNFVNEKPFINPIESLANQIPPFQNKITIPKQLLKDQKSKSLKQKIFTINQISCTEETLTKFQTRIFNELTQASLKNKIDLTELFKNWKSNNCIDNQFQSSRFLVKQKLEGLIRKIRIAKIWPKKKNYCQICFNDFSKEHNDYYSMKCDHKFCKQCYSSYMLNCFQTGKKLLDYKCPQEGCNVMAGIEDLKVFFNQSMIQAIVFKSISEVLNTHKTYSKCPTANCEMVHKFNFQNEILEISKDIENIQRNVYCYFCFQSYCNICKNQFHQPLSCSQFNQLQSLLLDDTWIAKNTKNCPKCFTKIEKNQGCSHMTCRSCQHEFCWDCLANFQNHVCNQQIQKKISDQISPKRQILFQNYTQSSEFIFSLKSQMSKCLYFQHQLLYDKEFEETFEIVVNLIKAYQKIQFWSQIYSNLNLLLFLQNKNDEKSQKFMSQLDLIYSNIKSVQRSLNTNFYKLSINKFNKEEFLAVENELLQIKFEFFESIEDACLLNFKNIQLCQLYCLP